MTAHRTVHLVGTIPTASAADAFALAVEVLGDDLPACLPDGETGDRLDWVNRIVERLRDHPDLELWKDGDWSGYENTPGFRVRPGHPFETVDLDYVHYFRASWPAFREVADRLGRHLRLQVGIPGHLDLALIASGFRPPVARKLLGPFRDATLREISVIQDAARHEVVFQIEIPIELILLTRIPGPVRKVVAAVMAREILKVVHRSARGARFGIHLCYGDLNHESMGTPIDAGPLVLLANALTAAWPEHQVLEFIHAPFALGAEPPPLDDAYYAPLADLRLPTSVRFAGGFIHEGRSGAELIELRNRIEELLGRRIDVAASCGLGRRDLARARRNLELSRLVADAEPSSPE